MILWATFFEIDIVSNADGQIIPAGEIKTIQHLEGGIIDQILVKESEKVAKEQPLVILAATASQVDVDELQVRIDSQEIKYWYTCDPGCDGEEGALIDHTTGWTVIETSVINYDWNAGWEEDYNELGFYLYPMSVPLTSFTFNWNISEPIFT